MKNVSLSRILILLFFMLLSTGAGVQASEQDVVMIVQSESANSFVITAYDPVGGGNVGDLSTTVWSAKNGQDDVKTQALNYADGKYTLTISNTDHNGDKGQYFIELSGPSGLLKSDFATLTVDGNEWIRYSYDGSGNLQKMTCRAVLTIDQNIENSTQEANSGADFKSGYGYTTTYKTSVTSNIEVEAEKALTGAGNSRILFPEFNFNKGVTLSDGFNQYNRLTDCTSRENLSNIANSVLELKTNPFSASDKRVHFTPIWYPDQTKYIVYAEVLDAWTPAGMLSTVVTDTFTVDGNVYDDWQVNNKRVQ